MTHSNIQSNQTLILSCLTSNKTQCPRDTEKMSILKV